MNRAILVSGINTEIGKTKLITALAAYWLKYNAHKEIALIKLVQTGHGDLEHYQALFKDQLFTILSPLIFDAPLAPPLAAALEGKSVDLGYLWQVFSHQRETKALVLAEGSGGLGSPITQELVFADLAASWNLATILVAPVQLGVIAQIVANVALARQKGVNILGIVLNCQSHLSQQQIDNWAPRDLIVQLTQTPVIGYFPYLEGDDLDLLVQAAANLDLEYIF